MVVFDRCGLYVESQTTLAAKIVAIDAIIDALIIQGADSIATENITEYQLNDGQTIIKQVYRGTTAIAKANDFWEAIKQRYVNRLNGRVVRSIDSKNFRNNHGSNR